MGISKKMPVEKLSRLWTFIKHIGNKSEDINLAGDNAVDDLTNLVNKYNNEENETVKGIMKSCAKRAIESYKGNNPWSLIPLWHILNDYDAVNKGINSYTDKLIQDNNLLRSLLVKSLYPKTSSHEQLIKDLRKEANLCLIALNNKVSDKQRIPLQKVQKTISQLIKGAVDDLERIDKIADSLKNYLDKPNEDAENQREGLSIIQEATNAIREDYLIALNKRLALFFTYAEAHDITIEKKDIEPLVEIFIYHRLDPFFKLIKEDYYLRKERKVTQLMKNITAKEEKRETCGMQHRKLVPQIVITEVN